MDESTYKRLIRKSKLPFPMKGVEVKIYSAVSLLLIAGMALSIRLNDWEWFARSGSLIIVVGIYWTWRDFVSLAGDVRKKYSDTIQEYLGVLDNLADWNGAPKGIIARAMAKGEMQREIEQSHTRALELFDVLRRRIRTTEAATLIIGTIVWGFWVACSAGFWTMKQSPNKLFLSDQGRYGYQKR